MTLSISILGPLAIESDDGRLGKVPKKARALIAFLAAQGGQPVSRERLADLLWPYQGSEQARHSLRNCLLELRKTLRPGAAAHLVADFANCRVHEVNVDIADFERLSQSQSRSELQAAADLYRGEVLADFYIASEPFQEWLATERDRTLRMVCDVLHRLTVQQITAGDHYAAIRSGRRLVSLDPLSEFGQRALMRAYARAGRRGEALRQYKNCAQVLRRELAVAPDAETETLASDIARSGGLTKTPAAEGGVADQGSSGSDVRPERSSGTGSRRVTVPVPRTGQPQWPCLLPHSAVAVAPVRNLTGDPDRQQLVEAFTEDLVTDLLRNSHGLSLKPLARKRRAGNGDAA
jgi:DNA-binding SARP family transcriptional activator